MKKLFFLLLAMSSLSSAIRIKKALFRLIGPVKSIDYKAEKILAWYCKRTTNGDYVLPDSQSIVFGGTAGEFRKKFPIDDTHKKDTLDTLSKILLLNDRSRSLANKIDEKTWDQQSKLNRLWLTVRYRRPYTYFLSLGKWAAEGALAVGAIKGVLALKKWYQKGAKDTLHISR